MKTLSILFTIAISAFLALTSYAQKPAAKPNDEDVRKAIFALEKENDRAIKVGDKAAIEALYADEFRGTNASGGETTKAQFVSFYGARTKPIAFHDSDQIDVRVFGATAIVRGRLRYQARAEDTPEWIRYTRVYVLRSSQWQIVAEHYCFIKEPT